MTLITLEPVGFVHSERKEAVDDAWDTVQSWIELSEAYSAESLAGLADFSHVEIVYFFHQVAEGQIVTGAEHPRENPNWPKVGIFAQRKRARPNRLGVTMVRLIKIEGRKLYVQSLDAIDGTPVVDIKPVFREYLPKGQVMQPAWASELMAHYWA